MLKLTVKPGEYLMIGDEIKVVFTGGSSKNMHILVDAPKSLNVARSAALVKYGLATKEEAGRHYKDRELSREAKAKIGAILMEERHKAGAGKEQEKRRGANAGARANVERANETAGAEMKARRAGAQGA